MRLLVLLAWRRFVADRRRSVLVVSLLAVPLLVGVLLATLMRTAEVPIEDRVEAIFGQSAAVVIPRGDVAEESLAGQRQRLASLLPGVAVEPEVNASGNLSVGDRAADVFIYGLAPVPAHQGRFTMDRGRLPASLGEIALSRTVARALQVKLGDHVTVVADGAAKRVVGVAVVPLDTTRSFAVELPEANSGRTPSDSAQGGRGPSMVLWHLPVLTDSQTASLEADQERWRLQTRARQTELLAEDFGADGGTSEQTLLVVAATLVALFLVALIIVATYLVMIGSLRREQRVLASVGASRRQRRLILAVHGGLAGICAAIIGIALGLLGAKLAAPAVGRQVQQVWDSIRPPWTIVAGLGLAVALIPGGAAIAVSRGAGSLDPNPTARRKRPPIIVASLFAAGAIVAFMGAVTGLVGLIVAAVPPAIVGASLALNRMVRRVQIGDRHQMIARLAVRLTQEAPARVTAVATVVMTLVVVLGLTLAFYGGMSVTAVKSYVPAGPRGSLLVYATSQLRPDTAAAVAEELKRPVVRLAVAVPPPPPSSEPMSGWGTFAVRTPFDTCMSGSNGSASAADRCRLQTDYWADQTLIFVVDAAGLEAVIGRGLSSDERDAFADGEIVSTDSRLVESGRLTIINGLSGATESASGRVLTMAPQRFRNHPNAFVSAAGLARLGGVEQPDEGLWYAPPGQEISAVAEAKIRALISNDVGAGRFLLQVERGSDVVRVLLAMLTAGLGVIGIVAAGLGSLTVALAGRELRPVMSALAAIGVTRRQRVAMATRYAVVVVGLGLAAGSALLVVLAPSIAIAARVPFSWWAPLGVTAIDAMALAAAWATAHRTGAAIGTITRRDLE